MPYSLISQINPPSNISDFFIWGSEFRNINFIAENIYALLSKKKKSVKHHFMFFSPSGEYLTKYIYSSDDFISKIKLPLITQEFKYLSFIHQTIYKETFDSFLSKIGFEKPLKVIPQSRGYTQYYTSHSPLGNCVHGNFGGLTFNDIKTAKQRNSHIYTPAYEFRNDYIYDLVFNNPTSKRLTIEAKYLRNAKTDKIDIDTMGTDFLTVKNYSGPISFLSKLPICRPLIFKNPPPINKDFDILHS